MSETESQYTTRDFTPRLLNRKLESISSVNDFRETHGFKKNMSNEKEKNSGSKFDRSNINADQLLLDKQSDKRQININNISNKRGSLPEA